ncbi:hypothetical protein GXM_01328 [Nostoc sphaeroides CCNUC1]|uniref:Uncharacterized protein n=1 Tax=Nostoc sphaeroides CCNUC1 TaxID=2653204 RepID=A0A5P8VTU2_9NOSO|nr:hypothetical protein GXM_01328 [Nostoc sphaeroides CCNUC1]
MPISLKDILKVFDCDFNCIVTPLSPPDVLGGNKKNPVPSPIHRGGLGRSKKIFDISITTFKTSS